MVASSLADAVRAELRKDQVKLWEPPYTPSASSCAASSSDASQLDALEKLARAVAARISCDAAEVQAVLEELRLHAVEKLRAKSRVTLLGKAVVGSREEVCFEVDALHTGAKVNEDLRFRLGVARLKLISSGKALQENDMSLQQQGWLSDQDRGGKPLKVIFIASGVAVATASSDTCARVDSTPSTSVANGDVSFAGASAPTHPEQPVADQPACPVAQVREAAEHLTAEGFGDFELSDAATGRLVPVPPAARQPLIAAIALHVRGREALQSHDRGDKDAVAGALEFLVEADQCFERCRDRGAAQLLEMLGNYGQLQLDICWAYARLDNADYLPDAEARLQVAERMVERQVDRNFLTLSGVKAEQGATLTPEVIPSVRLWLLRGIAKRYRGDVVGAKDDLERAALFLRGLRVDEGPVCNLINFGVTRIQAVAALRRCEGSADRAADDLISAAPQREAAKREREEQRKLGQTEDGSFVNPDIVKQLVGMGLKKEVAVAALKKANNDLDAALTLVQTTSEDSLLGRAVKRKHEDDIPIDDLALAQLISLGFDSAAAEAALRKVGGSSVEEALLALTHQEDGSKESAVAGVSSSSTTPVLAAGESAPKEQPTIEKDTAEKEEAAPKEQPTIEKDTAGKEEEEEEARKKKEAADAVTAAKKVAKDAARELIERELGNCLRRRDMDEEIAGAALEEGEALVQQHLSVL